MVGSAAAGFFLPVLLGYLLLSALHTKSLTDSALAKQKRCLVCHSVIKESFAPLLSAERQIICTRGTISATMLDIGQFDLQRRMSDAEFIAQGVGDVLEKSISRMPRRHDEMGSKRNPCCTHGPDMEIMHASDAWLIP